MQYRPLKAAFFMIGASMLFVGMNLSAKLVPGNISSFEIAFFRSLVNFIVLLPIMIKKRLPFLGNNKKILFLRGLLGFTSLSLVFYSVKHGLLAETSILVKVSILVSGIFSTIFIGEKFDKKTFCFSIIGFIGAFFIVKPSANNLLNFPAVASLIAGIIIGLITVTIRKLQETDNSITIVFAFSLWGTFAGLALCAPGFIFPDSEQLFFLLLTGIIGLFAQILFTQSFKYGPPSKIHPFMYSEIIFSVLLGYYIFNEFLDIYSLIGCILIVSSGLAILMQNNIIREIDKK